MPPLQPISLPKQLLVEGFDAARLLQALVGHLKLGDIQVQNFGGNWELAAFLIALRALPNFEAQVTSVGIVRDADANPAAALQSVRAALRKAGLEALDRPGIPTETNPRTAVFILPDGETPGMLKSLCLAAVEGEPAIGCVDKYVACITSETGAQPKNLAKARLYAYLAAQPKPGLRLVEAAEAGVWPWDHPAFDLLKDFLRAL